MKYKFILFLPGYLKAQMIFACIYIYWHLEADRAASVNDGFERL